jgi:hypothetical protein
MTKIAGSGSESGSGSISQRHGFPDPDPHQNVVDPEHWFFVGVLEVSDENSRILIRWAEAWFRGSGSISKCF